MFKDLKVTDKDKKILNILLEDGRIPFTQVSKRLEIADSTIHFRVKKLQEEGIIKRFTVDLDLKGLGYIKQAIVIFSVRDLIEERRIKKVRDYANQLKNNEDVAFLSVAENEKMIIALIVSNNPAKFKRILENFIEGPDFEDVKIYNIDRIEKTRIDRVF